MRTPSYKRTRAHFEIINIDIGSSDKRGQDGEESLSFKLGSKGKKYGKEVEGKNGKEGKDGEEEKYGEEGKEGEEGNE